MMPRFVFELPLNRMLGLFIGHILLLTLVGCGGGGSDGGGLKLNPEENVTISGKVDDGTSNSPIQNAQCRFVYQDGYLSAVSNTNTNGEFSIVVLKNVEGLINFNPLNLHKLKLYTFSSTVGKEAGEKFPVRT